MFRDYFLARMARATCRYVPRVADDSNLNHPQWSVRVLWEDNV